ncbi:MAG: hypothetical protein ABF991_05365 [Liquorilactobacillus hordei]|uniref:hypothetical protein n=1 Tax=Liquorilactobacillus TaxID=2767888 RepID=UPI000A420CD6|nr:hypothetical protein [Liquorilactobacillus cacaonum]
MKKFNILVLQFVKNLPFLIVLCGVSSLIYAAFRMNQTLGFAILGVGLILVAFMVSPNE